MSDRKQRGPRKRSYENIRLLEHDRAEWDAKPIGIGMTLVLTIPVRVVKKLGLDRNTRVKVIVVRQNEH